MIKINQLKLKSEEVHEAKRRGAPGLRELLKNRAAVVLRVPGESILRLDICRESLDARKKPDIFYSYTLELYLEREERLLQRLWARQGKGRKPGEESFINIGGVQIAPAQPLVYHFPKSGSRELQHPIVIVGTGPAGLFCGYFLALHGYCPILLERGKCVEEREQDVKHFWETGVLDPNSNVQFGEGGAGTFSDGKLNTLVKDKNGRNRAVLQVFVDCGAKEEILYEAKPHLGTDVLCRVVRRMREKILEQGGQVRFESQVTDVDIRNGKVHGVEINHETFLPCEQLVLAVGHSARDTFEMLYQKQIPMETKAFAVGFRVEHPQELINRSQYGTADAGDFGAAAYKLTARAEDGRGVYSFCMCPGGYVVNASSEQGRLAINGMSYSGRNGKNANSAVIVAVTPADYDSEDALAGVEFQRKLEERAFLLAGGSIPMQRYGVFKACVTQDKVQEELFPMIEVDTGGILGDNSDCGVFPEHKGSGAWADLSGLLPHACSWAFVQGMERFGQQIPGFNGPDTILSGVESRTSSPLRIHRDETLQSNVRGLYPCGEGAGYAGGITSAAMDGLLVAEQIAAVYAPQKKE